jgi:hypothetical protein
MRTAEPLFQLAGSAEMRTGKMAAPETRHSGRNLIGKILQFAAYTEN